MKVKCFIDFEIDTANIHDVLAELGFRNITDDMCIKAFNWAPIEIKSAAAQWGSADTEFRDDLYTFLKRNRHLLDTL